MLGQRFLAPPVPPVHAPKLRNGDVALIGEHQSVVRNVLEQGRWGLAGIAPGKVPGVILDARAATRRLEHLQIMPCAIPETLRLKKHPVPLKFGSRISSSTRMPLIAWSMVGRGVT